MNQAQAVDLWCQLLNDQKGGDGFGEWALNCVLQSVLVDLVNNRMADNEEFALVIGRRISRLYEAKDIKL